MSDADDDDHDDPGETNDRFPENPKIQKMMNFGPFGTNINAFDAECRGESEKTRILEPPQKQSSNVADLFLENGRWFLQGVEMMMREE